MAQFATFPPSRLHASRDVSQSEALNLVSTYLEAASNDAALHPNALLTESGPVSANSGTELGLVLHNLQRVEAGLKGELLEPELVLGDMDVDGDLGNVPVIGSHGQTTDGAKDQSKVSRSDIPEEEWQDKEDFEREQEEEQGEIAPQIQATREQLSGGAPQVTSTKSASEKADRKKRKQEKRLQEKRDRTQKLKQQKDMDET